MRRRFSIHVGAALLSLAATGVTALGGGCESKVVGVRTAGTGNSTSQPAVDPRYETTWKESPVSLTPSSVCVTQGPSPLVHLFDVGGPIRVVDLTDQRPLYAARVVDRTLVRVDVRNGVVIGSQAVVPGPLVAGHQYGIFLDPPTGNIIRRGLGPPGNTPVNVEQGK